jgi:hypothetical protein
VTINGAGSDTLNVFDQNDSYSDTYTLTSSTVTRTASTVISYSGLSAVTLNGGSGTETYNVNSTSAPLNLNAGSGNDTVNLGTGNLNSLAGAVAVNGQAGTDTVNLVDQNSDSETTVTSATVSRQGFSGLTYSGIENLTLDTDAIFPWSNNINVNSTASGVQTTINAGGDVDFNFVNIESTSGPLTLNLSGLLDVVNVSPSAQFLDNIQGNVTVHGNGHNIDELNVFDQSDSYSDTYTLTSSTVTRTYSAVISYSGLEDVECHGGSSNDTYDVNSSATNTRLYLDLGAGNNSVYVGSGDLTAVAGAVEVSGGSGTNALVLQDASAPSGGTYDVTSDGVTRQSFGGLSYGGVKSLTLNAESGNDTINVGSTAAGSSTVINAGAGNDTINVGSTAAGSSTVINAGAGNDTVNVGTAVSSLDALQGALTLSGQAGSDVLNFDDQAAAAGHNYTFTSTTLTRNGAAAITFDTFETVNLIATSHNDTLTLQSLPKAVMDMELGVCDPNGYNNVYGPNTSNTWMINPYLNGVSHVQLNGQYKIGGLTALCGGTAPDRFEFMSGGVIPVAINGGGGGDTLDYSQYNTAVNVNLGAYGNGTYGFATGVGSSVVNIQTVIGSAYNDVLAGSIYGSVLDGGAGNDTLTAYNGGTARNVLIGGTGSDSLKGGPNGDVLIGGSTSFDNPTTNANALAALNAIFAEWSSADTYAQRVQYLSGPTGHYNGSYFLIPTGTGQTVFDDGVNDTITAGAGSNWMLPS